MSGNGQLTVLLPQVVSWSRPRVARGRVRYTGRYAIWRDRWAGEVRAAMADQAWARPPKGTRIAVGISVRGGLNCDLDRVLTAVLDCLQFGGALADDRDAWHLVANRVARKRRETPHVLVSLHALNDAA